MGQQRKRVFIDCSLPERRWFMDLPKEFKLAYVYIWLLSDNVGVWEPNMKLLDFYLETSIEPDELLSGVNRDNERIETVGNKWWIVDYISFQYDRLTPTNPPHISYLKDLREHGLLEQFIQEQPENVNFDKLQEILDSDKKKHIGVVNTLRNKGLLKVLVEASKSLERTLHAPKEKEKEKDADKDEMQEKEMYSPFTTAPSNKNGKDSLESASKAVETEKYKLDEDELDELPF